MKNQRGFTLLELLTVIAIIGFLTTSAFVAVSTSRERARLAASLQFNQIIHQGLGDVLTASWSFESSVSPLADTSGGLNTGILLGIGLETADTVAGNAIILDSNTDSVKLAQNVFSFPMTATFWMNSNDSGEGFILWGADIANGDGFGVDHECHLGVVANTNFRIWCNTEGTKNLDQIVVGVVNKNTWQHVAAVFDTTQFLLYIDGVEVSGGIAYTGVPNFSSYIDNAMYIGRAFTVLSNRNFVGMIDEMAVYAESLTLAQIQKLYAESAPKYKLVLE